ncbi:hypothetical protein C9439_05750 [archaeon SCG-AAA382B04]|nr:hypothetical protein C9439_05750 [archaeon SCG-AAA382B04]
MIWGCALEKTSPKQKIINLRPNNFLIPGRGGIFGDKRWCAGDKEEAFQARSDSFGLRPRNEGPRIEVRDCELIRCNPYRKVQRNGGHRYYHGEDVREEDK